jgi:hypothetical protein
MKKVLKNFLKRTAHTTDDELDDAALEAAFEVASAAPEPEVDVDLRGFLNRLADLSVEYGIVIEGDVACLYALDHADGAVRAERTFIADGLGFADEVPRYYCCPHVVTRCDNR